MAEWEERKKYGRMTKMEEILGWQNEREVKCGRRKAERNVAIYGRMADGEKLR